MPIELEDPFAELCNTFEIDEAEEAEVIESKVNEKQEELHNRLAVVEEATSTKQKYDLQDKELIRFELQSLVEENKMVLQALADQCKAGAAPRLFEVYANLSNTVRDTLRELRDINKTITDYQVIEDREQLKRETFEAKKASIANTPNAIAQDGGTVNIQNNLTLTSQQMLDIIKELNLPKKETTLEELPQFDLS